MDRQQIKSALTLELRELMQGNDYNALYAAAYWLEKNHIGEAKKTIAGMVGSICAGAEKTVHEKIRADFMAALKCAAAS